MNHERLDNARRLPRHEGPCYYGTTWERPKPSLWPVAGLVAIILSALLVLAMLYLIIQSSAPAPRPAQSGHPISTSQAGGGAS